MCERETEAEETISLEVRVGSLNSKHSEARRRRRTGISGFELDDENFYNGTSRVGKYQNERKWIFEEKKERERERERERKKERENERTNEVHMHVKI